MVPGERMQLDSPGHHIDIVPALKKMDPAAVARWQLNYHTDHIWIAPGLMKIDCFVDPQEPLFGYPERHNALALAIMKKDPERLAY